MKKSVLLFIVLLITTVLVVEFDLMSRQSQKNNMAKNKKTSPTTLAVTQLTEVIENKNANEEKRAKAIHTLAQKQTVESLKQLEEFILENSKEASEAALKAEAIEGIATYPQKELAITSLSVLEDRIQDQFLKNRIKKSLLSLKQSEESSNLDSSEQDSSLKKLVQ